MRNTEMVGTKIEEVIEKRQGHIGETDMIDEGKGNYCDTLEIDASKQIDEEEDIIITEDMLEKMKPLRGRVFKEFMKMGTDKDADEDTDKIFGVFVAESLKPLGIEIDDPYDDLTLKDFTEVLSRVMELNNMDELFRSINRLTRFTPKSE